MPTRRFSGIATSASVPDNGGDNSGGNSGGVDSADKAFSTYVYTGTGAPRDIENGIDLEGEGGMVWIKWRGGPGFASRPHFLVDTERGVGPSLSSDSSGANSNTNLLSSFNSDGFSISDQNIGFSNWLGEDYVSWTFRKAPKFFDVVTYTGTGPAQVQTISHSLDSSVGMLIVKSTDAAGGWYTWHRGYGDNGYMQLQSDFPKSPYADLWADTAPTSTDFTVSDSLNTNNEKYVAYLFAHDDSDESMIQCGGYTGNETLDGPEIDLGFEPQWLLTKSSTATGNWSLIDNIRGAVTNGDDKYLSPNTSQQEITEERIIFTPTGFKVTSWSGGVNQSGEDFIYIAIRRPNKPAEEFDPEELFKTNNPSTAGDDAFESGFPVDMSIRRFVNVSDGPYLAARLGGPRYLLTSSTAAELSDASSVFDSNEGWANGWSSNTNHFSWMWRRAPGFLDVVAYTGTGGARALNHNLGAVPEMIWLKSRTNTAFWCVYHSAPGPTKYLQLSESVPETTQNTIWDDTAPTDTNFTVGAYMNQSHNYIAYLFASVPGISRLGSYTGTGADLDVDCGFTTGARFVLVKRTDSTGDWYVWDSVRGITVGNDPYTLLNTTDAEVTNTDYIDPLSSGFKVTASAPAAINAANGEYIFYAIA